MKNLEVIALETIKNEILNSVFAFCMDPETMVVYLVTKAGLVKKDDAGLSVCFPVSCFETYLTDKELHEDVIDITYLCFDQSICIISSNGNFLMCSTDGSDTVECVGTIDSGVQACCWSPDQELVVVLTGEGKLIMMTQTFEPIYETSILAADPGENELVNVGWGKKETQFHGSEGKHAAKTSHDKPTSTLQWDDGKPRISWRGDGNLFVISVISEAVGFRNLRIYGREGNLQCIGEDIIGLEQCVHWKPSGNLIACTQQHQNKHKVIFVEKNGLQHGEFVLPYQYGETLIKQLMWNSDSGILALSCQHIKKPLSTPDKVTASWIDLWTVGNYHWYLKQTLKFEDSVKNFKWDVENPFLLHVVCDDFSYRRFKLQWVVNRSSWMSLNDNGIVAVIDGVDLLITPFRSMIVPPPMSAYKLNYAKPINQVLLCPESNNLAAVSSDGKLIIYKIPSFDSNVDKENSKCLKTNACSHELCCIVDISDVNVPSFGQWQWITPSIFMHMCIIKRTSLLNKYCLETNNEGTVLKHVNEISVPTIIAIISRSLNSQTLFIHVDDGKVMKYDHQKNEIAPFLDDQGTAVKFPVVCHTITSMEVGGSSIVIGLNDNFRLYCNNTELAKDCTSFCIQDEFLLFTTHQHILRCIPLKNLNSTSTEDLIKNSMTRVVERGSQLIISIPFDTRVVMQMPRGNLEVIHPRSLVLSMISKYLDIIKYKNAFSLMRKHRINLNLIYDHDPQSFLSHIEDFIVQLNDSSSICQFISDLEDQDFTKTMYSKYFPYNLLQDNSSTECINKVDSVCDAVRQVMEEIDYNGLILTILTCHVKKKLPEIELALQKIQRLHQDGALHMVNECLKHLMYLVDVNKLFDYALGMYDFDIVLMVAEKSQKDPKEYLPFLNELKQMETNYSCFKIDSYLKLHKKALVHLSKCPEYQQEFYSYMKMYDLYSVAATLFSADSDQYNCVASMYASWLLSKKLYDESAIWFVKAKLYEKAVDCFAESMNWKLAIVYAYKSKYSKAEMIKLCRKIVPRLIAVRLHLEAGLILEQYVQDVEECVVTLTNGHEWEEVMKVIHRHDRLDLIETNLLPELLISVNVVMQNMQSLEETMKMHKSRLFVVREEKRKKAEFAFDNEEYNDAEADLYSDASSVRSLQSSTSSNRSQRSRMSSKSRRKMERKKYSLKEGSKFEEEALIIELAEIANQVNTLKEQIHKLELVLCLLNHEQEALGLQSKMEMLLKYIQSSAPDIWPDNSNKANESQYGSSSTASSIVRSMNQHQFPERKIDNDMLRLMLPPKTNDSKWTLDFLKDLK